MPAVTLSSATLAADGETVTFAFTGAATGFTLTTGITGFVVESLYQNSNTPSGKPTFANATSSGLNVVAVLGAPIGNFDRLRLGYVPGNLVDNLNGVTHSVLAFGNVTPVNNSLVQTAEPGSIRTAGPVWYGA